MIKIIGYFRDKVVSRIFDNEWDAMDYRDTLDAHYVSRIEWINL
tara:strand:- start:293 stop:424 length:132 start_codon:yes stop_codon:yes gene_type:complete